MLKTILASSVLLLSYTVKAENVFIVVKGEGRSSSNNDATALSSFNDYFEGLHRARKNLSDLLNNECLKQHGQPADRICFTEESHRESCTQYDIGIKCDVDHYNSGKKFCKVDENDLSVWNSPWETWSAISPKDFVGFGEECKFRMRSTDLNK